MDLKCPKCGKMLATKEEMAEHAKTHAKEGMDKMKSGFKIQIFSSVLLGNLCLKNIRDQTNTTT